MTWRWLIVPILLASSAAPVVAEYRLQPGDTLELSVAGFPDLSQKSTIGPDGEASFPVVSLVRIADLSLRNAQETVRHLFQSQVLQRRTPDGRDVATTISPATISLTITEYRPVYVNGDVSKPGEQTYRPGMTVRQAIAMAGGLDLVRIRMDNPFLEAAEFAGEYQSLWTDHARLTARKWRYEAELQSHSASIGPVISPAVPEALGQAIVQNASEELEASVASAEAQKTHLQDIVAKSDAQLKLLQSRQESDEEGAEADAVDYKRLQSLAARGNILQNRLSESRRLLLLSTTQSLQTRIQIAQVERERSKAQRDIQLLEEQRRIEALREVNKASTELAKVKARIGAVAEKMTYTGLIRSQLIGDEIRRPRIQIVRAGSSGEISADEETVLAPGDTIEVALQVPHNGEEAADAKSARHETPQVRP